MHKGEVKDQVYEARIHMKNLFLMLLVVGLIPTFIQMLPEPGHMILVERLIRIYTPSNTLYICSSVLYVCMQPCLKFHELPLHHGSTHARTVHTEDAQHSCMQRQVQSMTTHAVCWLRDLSVHSSTVEGSVYR